MCGVQCCFHFDRSSHDAFLKCISRGTQALREKSTAPVAHMNQTTRHPKTWRRTLLHPAPRRPVKVCCPKSNADAQHRLAQGGRWNLSRDPIALKDKTDRSREKTLRNIEKRTQTHTLCKSAWETTQLARDLARTLLRSHYTRDARNMFSCTNTSL